MCKRKWDRYKIFCIANRYVAILYIRLSIEYGIITLNFLHIWMGDMVMAQEANVLMGLSVKAMIFFEGKLLLLQKK